MGAVFGQSSINSGGGFAAENNVKVSYSIGQVFYANSSNAVFSNNEGIGQSFEIELVAANSLKSNTDVSLYPNPVNDKLVIENGSQDTYEYQILDLSGKQIVVGKLSFGKQIISVSALKEAIYILKITGNNSIESYKIKKR